MSLSQRGFLLSHTEASPSAQPLLPKARPSQDSLQPTCGNRYCRAFLSTALGTSTTELAGVCFHPVTESLCVTARPSRPTSWASTSKNTVCSTQEARRWHWTQPFILCACISVHTCVYLCPWVRCCQVSTLASLPVPYIIGMPGFYMDSGDPNPGPHFLAASTLLTDCY